MGKPEFSTREKKYSTDGSRTLWTVSTKRQGDYSMDGELSAIAGKHSLELKRRQVDTFQHPRLCNGNEADRICRHLGFLRKKLF